jgi:hypothetical protein
MEDTIKMGCENVDWIRLLRLGISGEFLSFSEGLCVLESGTHSGIGSLVKGDMTGSVFRFPVESGRVGSDAVCVTVSNPGSHNTRSVPG